MYHGQSHGDLSHKPSSDFQLAVAVSKREKHKFFITPNSSMFSALQDLKDQIDSISKAFQNINGQKSKEWFGGPFKLGLSFIALVIIIFKMTIRILQTLCPFPFTSEVKNYSLNSHLERMGKELPPLCTPGVRDEDWQENSLCFQIAPLPHPFQATPATRNASTPCGHCRIYLGIC